MITGSDIPVSLIAKCDLKKCNYDKCDKIINPITRNNNAIKPHRYKLLKYCSENCAQMHFHDKVREKKRLKRKAQELCDSWLYRPAL